MPSLLAGKSELKPLGARLRLGNSTLIGITKKKSANLLCVIKKAGDRFIVSGCYIRIDKLLSMKRGGQRVMLKYSSIISSSPEIMGGIPVFAGTRVPVQTLLDYLKAGESIDDFLDGFPTVTREQVIAFLEEAGKQIVETVT